VTRWAPEQVEAIAPTPAAMTAARPLVSLTRWGSVGADERAVWGVCRGSGAEPYDTMVDHVGVGFSCTCPSRRRPCKHALALLMLWAQGQVVDGIAPPAVNAWMSRRTRTQEVGGGEVGGGEAKGGEVGGGEAVSPATDQSPGTEPTPAAPDSVPESSDAPDRDRGRDERVERMYAGLAELDRWLDDRMRTGLADPALARYGTWDQLAARLVDARAGSLANRVRRLAGLVGASPDWHGEVLAELGLLHLLSQAARRLGSLPEPLADAVATTVGWQVRQADVLGGVPDTDEWIVAGRSDTREDRIEVRRHWLRGRNSGGWALVLSFAAYRQSLDTSLEVGTSVHADLHRYPGPALRALVGVRHGEPLDAARPPAADVAGACDEIGSILVGEPWLDRVPATVRGAVTQSGSGWVLTDDTGSLPLLGGRSMATLLAISGGEPVDVTVEWTPRGVVPLTIHLPDRSIDVGPRADDSFVSAS
jgi:SWIM zinc finger